MLARVKSTPGGRILVELLMLVVGINIALWFEGQFQEFEDARTEREYLAGLRDDLVRDLALLDAVIEHDREKIEQLNTIIPRLSALARASAEEQAETFFAPSSYLFFEPSDFTYRAMQESGDFRLLSDPDIREDLLRLMRQYRLIDTLQNNFLQALDDGYIPLMMTYFDLVAMRLADTAVLEKPGFRNFFAYTKQDTGQRLYAVEGAREQAAELLGRIRTQLGDV